MTDKKKPTGKASSETAASKLRDLEMLDSRVEKVKGGAKRKVGRQRSDP